jgi:hypothetical protein
MHNGTPPDNETQRFGGVSGPLTGDYVCPGWIYADRLDDQVGRVGRRLGTQHSAGRTPAIFHDRNRNMSKRYGAGQLDNTGPAPCLHETPLRRARKRRRS